MRKVLFVVVFLFAATCAQAQTAKIVGIGASFGMEIAGRWALARRGQLAQNRSARNGARAGSEAIEHMARTLLRRYGVVFWRLLEREANWLPPWREFLHVYRKLEARGERARLAVWR